MAQKQLTKINSALTMIFLIKLLIKITVADVETIYFSL